MKSKLLPIVLLILLISGYLLLFPIVEHARDPLKRVQDRGMIFPPFVTKIISFEYKSIAADFLFARASQYLGGKIANRETMDNSDMMWLYRNMLVITDLDPYFEDPYYLGNAFLTWDVGMVKEANVLLKKGVDARSWDWQLPFYLGFNKFYFLQKNSEAADYFVIASKRPGAHNFLPTLAARLYNNEGSTKMAIVILKEFLENERDSRIRARYEMRVAALEKMLFLESAVSQYRAKSGKFPRNLQTLVQSGIIAKIPKDPYGGVFYLDKDGSVKTSSKLAPIIPNTTTDKDKKFSPSLQYAPRDS